VAKSRGMERWHGRERIGQQLFPAATILQLGVACGCPNPNPSEPSAPPHQGSAKELRGGCVSDALGLLRLS